MGYACRVSDKLPEDCMKENSAYTPTAILTGWKNADTDIKDKGKKTHSEDEPKTEGETKPDGDPATKPEAAPTETPAKH